MAKTVTVGAHGNAVMMGQEEKSVWSLCKYEGRILLAIKLNYQKDMNIKHENVRT